MEDALQILIVVTGYVGVAIVSLFALLVLWNIFSGKIDLAKLISEESGAASMSRFQFLIFTFVIGFGLVLFTLIQAKAGLAAGATVPKFPEIGAGVMALLGISGGTYVVSKGIQKSNDSKTGAKNAGGSAGGTGWPRA